MPNLECEFDIHIRRSDIGEVTDHLLKVLRFPKNTVRHEEFTDPNQTHPDLIYGFHPNNPASSGIEVASSIDGCDFIVQCLHRYPEWENTIPYRISVKSQFVSTKLSEQLIDKLEGSFSGLWRYLRNL